MGGAVCAGVRDLVSRSNFLKVLVRDFSSSGLDCRNACRVLFGVRCHRAMKGFYVEEALKSQTASSLAQVKTW